MLFILRAVLEGYRLCVVGAVIILALFANLVRARIVEIMFRHVVPY